MSYLSDFERSFSDHTLQLVRGYEGPFDATLMVNCLLGLLVVPKDKRGQMNIQANAHLTPKL